MNLMLMFGFENQKQIKKGKAFNNKNKMMPFILIVVSLTRYQSHYCLGYIINNNLILTLSSCLKRFVGYFL